jgi:hypothetical protein
MQFLIQLAATIGVIYWAQGLTLDHLAFDPNTIYKHGLTYITFSRIKNKKNLYLLQPLQMKIFQIDSSIVIEMHQLQTITWCDILIHTPHTFCHSHVFICFLNIISLSLHKNDMFFDYNLKTSSILCLIETHFNPQTSNNISFIDPSKI